MEEYRIDKLPELHKVRYSEQIVDLYCDNEQLGRGQLLVDDTKLVWWNEEKTIGYAIEYPSIVLHAICRDTTEFPRMCIYCQITKHESNNGQSSLDNHDSTILADSENKDTDDSDSSDKDVHDSSSETESIVELRICPFEGNHLDSIFKFIAECSALYPNPLEDENESELLEFNNPDDLSELGKERLSRIFQMENSDGTVQIAHDMDDTADRKRKNDDLEC